MDESKEMGVQGVGAVDSTETFVSDGGKPRLSTQMGTTRGRADGLRSGEKAEQGMHL